jgi:hypothetical protein
MGIALPGIAPGEAIDAAMEELSRPCYQLMLGAYVHGILTHRIEPPDWKPIETGSFRPSQMRCIRFERRLQHTRDRINR